MGIVREVLPMPQTFQVCELSWFAQNYWIISTIVKPWFTIIHQKLITVLCSIQGFGTIGEVIFVSMGIGGEVATNRIRSFGVHSLQ